MLSRIDRIRRAVSAQSAPGTDETEAEAAFAAASVNLPVPVGPVRGSRTFRDERRPGDSEFAAQVMGQDGQRRGLRAGPHIHDVARSAYNSVEWSGAYDRRAPAGRTTREKI